MSQPQRRLNASQRRQRNLDNYRTELDHERERRLLHTAHFLFIHSLMRNCLYTKTNQGFITQLDGLKFLLASHYRFYTTVQQILQLLPSQDCPYCNTGFLGNVRNLFQGIDKPFHQMPNLPAIPAKLESLNFLLPIHFFMPLCDASENSTIHESFESEGEPSTTHEVNLIHLSPLSPPISCNVWFPLDEKVPCLPSTPSVYISVASQTDAHSHNAAVYVHILFIIAIVAVTIFVWRWF